MRKAKLLGLVLLLGLFTIPATAGARGPGKSQIPMPPGKWWKTPQAAEELSLTVQEQERMDTMYLEHRRRMIDLRSQVQKKRLELEQIMDSQAFDKSACMEAFKKLQEASDKLAMERFKFLVQVRELLGLERFQELKSEFQRHRMKQSHSKRDRYLNQRCPG